MEPRPSASTTFLFSGQNFLAQHYSGLLADSTACWQAQHGDQCGPRRFENEGTAYRGRRRSDADDSDFAKHIAAEPENGVAGSL
jgi:hypothetical protein